MREELPDIPQENTLVSNSMHLQLSQRSEPRTHRRFFEGPTETGRIVALMREQIEITCQAYADAIKGQLQEQARQIQRLSAKLRDNQSELDRKQAHLERLTEEIRQCKKKSGSTLEMAELRRRVDQCVAKEQELQKKMEQQQKTYRFKLQQLSEDYACKMEEVKEEMEERMDRVEKLIQLAQCETRPSRRPTLTAHSQSAHLARNLASVQSELAQLRLEVAAIANKQHKYENFRLEHLAEQMRQMERRLSQIEGSRTLKSSQMTRTESPKGRFINKYRSLLSIRQQRDSPTSDSDSEVQPTLIEEEKQNNITRLAKILREMQLSGPLRIEIDQTGYAKSVQTGMYLVDSSGDGFEFSNQELDYLLAQRIILI